MDRPLTPEERRWLKRLQRVLDERPPGLVIYCHGDTATVLDAEAARKADDWGRRAAILEAAHGLDTRGWIAGDF